MTALTAPLSRRTFVRWRASVVPTAEPGESSELMDSTSTVVSSADVPVDPAPEFAPEASSAVEADEVATPEPPARGGVFAGTKAQIRLTPSKATTHPTTGRRGDLFVDATGRLWFCRSGGKNASWKLVKLV